MLSHEFTVNKIVCTKVCSIENEGTNGICEEQISGLSDIYITIYAQKMSEDKFNSFMALLNTQKELFITL